MGKLESFLGQVLKATLAPEVKSALSLEATPKIAYASTTTADSKFFSVVPASGKYVHLMLVAYTVGTDGDRVECKFVDKDGVERTFCDLAALANTSIVLGFPNLKMDKVNVAGTEYEVLKGDGSTDVIRFYSRGTGAWKLFVLWYEGA